MRETRLERLGEGAALIHGAVAPPPEVPDAKARPPILIDDFESGGFGDWKVEGEAFGAETGNGRLAGSESREWFRRIPADEFLLRRRQEHGRPLEALAASSASISTSSSAAGTTSSPAFD